MGLAYDYCLTDCTKNNGNVLKQTISFTGFSEAQTYSYDALNRLQQAQTPVWTQKNGYDAWGNRWVSQQTNLWPLSSLTPQGTDTSSSWFDTNKNQISSWSYDHGNLLNAGVNGLTYDGENRITARTNAPNSTQYGYDAEGQRITKTELLSGQVQSTTVFVYDGQGQLAAEYGSSTDIGRSYLIGDALGSTRLIVGATGAVKARYDYLPFGEEIWATYGGRTTAQKYRDAATFDQPDGTTGMKFTAQLRDAETGLDWFNTRYMSSAQGRFTSPDQPIIDQFPQHPQSWNMYSYGRNNPLKYTDPTGQAVQVCANDESGKQTCVVMSDPQYAAAIAGNNPGVNAPAAGATAGPGGGLAIGGAITCGGAVCGSATYQEESMQDTTGDLVAIGQFGASLPSLVRGGASLGQSLARGIAGFFSKEAGAVAKVTVQDILQGAVREGGSRTEIYSKPGGFAQATKDFESL
jgi:RHS repeat-associated protein